MSDLLHTTDEFAIGLESSNRHLETMFVLSLDVAILSPFSFVYWYGPQIKAQPSLARLILCFR